MNLPLLLAGLVVFFAFAISALPLHLAVKILNGKTNIIKTILTMVLAGFIVAIVRSVVGIFGGLVAFIVLIWVYRISFQVGWVRAILIWLLQFVFLALLFMISFMAFGVVGLTTFLMG